MISTSETLFEIVIVNKSLDAANAIMAGNRSSLIASVIVASFAGVHPRSDPNIIRSQSLQSRYCRYSGARRRGDLAMPADGKARGES
jgi:hypothetical protein